MLLYILDLVGVFAFGYFGAHAGIRGGFNLWGIVLCGFMTALGGGTIRAVLLDRSPVYFYDYAYLIIALLAVIFAMSTRRYRRRLALPMIILDAIGLVIFAYIGAHAAVEAQLGIVISISFAFLTAFGGGIIVDVITRRSPQVFKDTWIVPPVVAIGSCSWLLGNEGAQGHVIVLLVSAFLFRIVTLYATTFHRIARGGYARTKQIVAFSFK